MKFGNSSDSSNTHVYCITYGNGKFVAGGGDNKGSYSTDGITWTAISDIKLGNKIAVTITYGNGKFVAGGGDKNGSYCIA